VAGTSVTVVILAYNSFSKGKGIFEKSLRSVLEQGYPSKRLIVVDNGSSDGTYEFAQAVCGGQLDCRVVRLPRNLGWAGGNNRGALLARGSRYILFLNDDAYLARRDCLSRLVACMERDGRLGAVQPVIIDRDGMLNLGGAVGLSGLPKMRSSPSLRLSYLSGAALMVRASAFFNAGMFDERLFLYHDDADFCWRLLARGWKIALAPDCLVFHQGSTTLGRNSPSYFYYMLRNNLWVLAKCAPLSQLPARVALALLESLVSFVGHWAIVRRDAAQLKAILRGLAEGLTSFGRFLSGAARFGGHEDPRVDLDLLFPASLRRALARLRRRLAGAEQVGSRDAGRTPGIAAG
jgi:GT2 family glycosyltransferase